MSETSVQRLYGVTEQAFNESLENQERLATLRLRTDKNNTEPQCPVPIQSETGEKIVEQSSKLLPRKSFEDIQRELLQVF